MSISYSFSRAHKHPERISIPPAQAHRLGALTTQHRPGLGSCRETPQHPCKTPHMQIRYGTEDSSLCNNRRQSVLQGSLSDQCRTSCNNSVKAAFVPSSSDRVNRSPDRRAAIIADLRPGLTRWPCVRNLPLNAIPTICFAA
jgi:hypothetical protein